MKNTYKLIVLVFVLIASSCQDVLQKVPLDVISDNVVWTDPALVNAYLAGMYDKTSVMVNESESNSRGAWADLGTSTVNSITFYGPFLINELSDESKRGWLYLTGDVVKAQGIRSGGGVLEWYETSYQIIRSCNELIQKVGASTIDTNLKKQYIAEAKFIRAFNYFAMVKRYGGVPILTQVGDIENPLYPKRDTEKAVYDFVINELDQIQPDLIEKNSDTNWGRATKFAALALQCRAALYAGSIAKYGKVDLDGVVGIPSNFANQYFQKAYDAANLIIGPNHANSNFQLYNAEADKTKNFRDLFLVKNNCEVIFNKKFDGNGTGNGWMYDFLQCPTPQAWNVGMQNAVYLDFVTDYEKNDGTKYDITAFTTGLHTSDEVWANMDPRFYATFYTQNTDWQGTKVDFHNGLIIPDGTIITSGEYNNVPAGGTQRGTGDFGTGFGVMKYLDETHNNMQSTANSSTDYIVFRYAEVLLNYAEAANELNINTDATWAINEIRNRAGMPVFSTLSGIDGREIIRHERKIELAFEGHRYWDLRRWRIAMDNIQKFHQGLQYILDYNSYVANPQSPKYQLKVLDKIDSDKFPPPFTEANYYLPITLGRIASSRGNLVENPGY